MKQRTCRQNEGLRGPRRERGRGLVTVPTVWVKEAKGQIMTNPNDDCKLILSLDYADDIVRLFTADAQD